VVLNKLEQNLSSDIRYCLVTPKTVKTCMHNSTYAQCVFTASLETLFATYARWVCVRSDRKSFH
jgi:hypothetical protein